MEAPATLEIGSLRAAFDVEHKRLYGQCSEKEPVEVVSYRVGAVGRVEKAELQPLPRQLHGRARPRAHRRILLEHETGWIDAPIYERNALGPGDSFTGPAIVEDRGSSFVLRPRHSINVDFYGNILVDLLNGQEKG